MERIFRLTLECNNAAFEGDPASEIARILRNLADRIEREGGDEMLTYRNVHDLNGNVVGTYALKGRNGDTLPSALSLPGSAQ